MSRTRVARSAPTSRWPQSPAVRSRMQRNLLIWFDRHRRRLPWRSSKTKYRVWISEVMLQQTQVTTVIPYFQRFIRRFPNVSRLANANESEVLRYWEGLGYYRRARQLHQAARIIMKRHDGRCPSSIEDWLALPGIGRYTAGAILSISDGQRFPILEANTLRLYARLLNRRGEIQSAGSRQKLWDFAADILPQRRVGDFNQALMEIGALICKPRQPDCRRCPLRMGCAAFAAKTVDRVPQKRPSVKPTRLMQTAVVLQYGNRVLLRLSQPGERWSGLWDLPRFDWTTRSSDTKLRQAIADQTGLDVEIGTSQFVMRYCVTRFQFELVCRQATIAGGKLRRTGDSPWAWIRREDLVNLPLNASARRVVQKSELLGWCWSSS